MTGYDHDGVNVHAHVHVLGTISMILNNDPINRTVKDDCTNNIQAQSDTPSDEYQLGVMNI